MTLQTTSLSLESQTRPYLYWLVGLVMMAFILCSKPALSAEDTVPDASEGSFVELDTITLPVFGARGKTTTLMFSLVAEVSEPETAEKIRALKPRLHDAYIRVLYDAVHSRRIITEGGYLDLPSVKHKLLKTSYRVTNMGPSDGFNDLLIRNVHHSKF